MSEYLDNIREITREDDYNTILKSSMGGYTKKSVLEYLASVKKQQEAFRDAYTSEVNELKAQLEKLRAEAAGAQEKAERIVTLERERDTLLSENGTLKEECASLEKDMDEAVARISQDAERINALETALKEEKGRNEAVKSSHATCKLMLDAAEDKAEKLAAVLREKEEKIASLEAENEYLKEHVAKEQIGELNDRITVLLSESEQLRSTLSTRNESLKTREEQTKQLLESLAGERENVENLKKELESSREKCEWQEKISTDLSERLLKQMEENLTLGKENSRLLAAAAILKRKAGSHEECAER